ncbi:GGDEF domain-containing protein [Streptomyces naganishii]|uniref:GGDEF domain-containing protein n=1 Tax=Streptomyces naganishii JCM 4654 TaxID=1306179 RepID=A0A918XZ37_9ACTN|nr:GGDEF domain-containing protein [Streptomyces naganishii]GHD84956.1 GGDEF domain-containing protein [Streptomyces naganishii JCM 4654]
MNDVMTALAAVAPLASGWAWHGVTMRRRLAAARRDPLSGLPTRAAFERRADRALARGQHVVIVMDLDGFKGLNDAFGHAAGDAAIRVTAMSLTGFLNGRRGSVAARLGGDEFAAVVPVTDRVALPWLLGGLHGAVTAPFRYSGRDLAVGASIGACVTSDLPVASLSLALRRADEAMYEAKRAGGGWRIAEGPALTHTTTAGRRTGRPGTSRGEAA